jgi:hypothetical protein
VTPRAIFREFPLARGVIISGRRVDEHAKAEVLELEVKEEEEEKA